MQKLTDGMRDFLERQPYATLATHNPDGSIHAVPLAYIFEDGLFFLAPSSSSKARNLAARP
jgi:general stress protein 26